MIIEVHITRHYGAVSWGISMEGSLPQGADVKELDRTVAQLNEYAMRQFAAFEQTHLPKFPPPPQGSGPQQQGGGLVTMNAAKLVKSVDRGQVRYNVITLEPAGAKYGIPVYPEVLERYPELEERMGGEYELDLTGVVIKVSVNDKRKKVVQFEGLNNASG